MSEEIATAEEIEQAIENIQTLGELYSEALIAAVLTTEEECDRERLKQMHISAGARFEASDGVKKTYARYEKTMNAYKAAQRKAKAKERSKIELQYDDKGRPVATVDSFLAIIEGDSHFSGAKYNLLTYSPEKVGADGKMERWTDADDAEVRRYIEQTYHIHNAQKCDDALKIYFARHQYHPIRDKIDSLVWDGKPRITDFLHKWTKCEDSEYTREVSRLIFAGGINRLYNIGCKFDDMAVLIGTKQGEGKSTLVRWLAMSDDYFAEVTEIEGQAGMEALQGAWICEIGELLALTRAKDVEGVKSFLTRTNDRYREPYSKRTSDHPRQCIFIGTTNKEQFLTDKTGNRRYYPVKSNQTGYCLFAHEDECRAYIEQCWAEAKALFDRGELPPFASRELLAEIRAMQGGAVEDDWRVGAIEDYLEQNPNRQICVMELYQKALGGGDFGKPTRKESDDIVQIMQGMSGWVRSKNPVRLKPYGRQMCWSKQYADDPDYPF